MPLMKNMVVCSASCFLPARRYVPNTANHRFDRKTGKVLPRNGYKQVKCITIFRRGMDSLMALVYRELYEGSDAAGGLPYRKTVCLARRQKAFDQKTDSQYSLEVAEKDFSEVAVMMSLSEKADFVRDRVKELVSRRGLRKNRVLALFCVFSDPFIRYFWAGY
jgi:hypothetical protein